MSNLPVISGLECIKALQKIGFVVRRQKGSHIILQRQSPFQMVVVPNHKTLKPGTLRNIIRDTGLSVEEFVRLL